ncbi:polysaccharide deacetylase family protein [Candidatus Roizmanbacteria bacterium]|nr:polysaccharide deacetylase family protein [Candidatus Roizmanbacteria bacterium]
MDKILNRLRNAFFISVRRLNYIVMGKFDRVMNNKQPEVFILCYHSIANDDSVRSVKLEEFKKQIEYLMKRYDFITGSDFEKYLDGVFKLKKPSILLTFDDGDKNLLNIKDFLRESKIYPTLFLIADRDNVDRTTLKTNSPLLKNAEVLELVKDGWSIGSHSMTHFSFTKLQQDNIFFEVEESKQKLEQELKIPIRYFAYPNGQYSQAIISTLKKANYRLAFSMDDELISLKTNRFAVPRIGVNNTHTLAEFKYLMSPSVILFRKFVKNSFVKKFYE